MTWHFLLANLGYSYPKLFKNKSLGYSYPKLSKNESLGYIDIIELMSFLV